MNINDIELYFETFDYANEDIEIMPGVYVLCESAEKFVTNTLQCLKSHPGNKNYMPYWEMLLKYYTECRKLS